MRVACLLINHLPVQMERARDSAPAERPLIIGGYRWDEGAVLDCCPLAASAGVKPGMRLTRAEALCPEARFLPAATEAYDAVHHALIDSVRSFTPTVEPDGLGLVYADASRLKRRFDDGADLAAQLMEKATHATALDVQVGVAGGKFIAQQAARAAEPGEACIVPSGEERAFLSPLDISVLPLDPEMERRLRLLGVHTLGTLIKLPRQAVLRQFGRSAGALYDLACGTDARPVHTNAPPLRLSRSHDFLDPVSDRAPLLAHVEDIAHGLAQEIDRRGYQAEGLLLEIEEVHGNRNAVGKPVKPPSSSGDRFSRLGAHMLESLTVSEPITSLALTIYPVRPFHLGTTQLALFRPSAISPLASHVTFGHALRETLRRLRDRFGELSVLVASLVGAPEPSSIQVTSDREGLPRGIVWRERIWEVQSICELWRERRRWWGRPIERDYFRLEIDGGQIRVIFRDVRGDQWYMERRHI